jgi:uncharacterized protein YciI
MRKRILLLSALTTLILTGFLSGGSSAQGQQKEGQFVGVFKATNPDFFKKGPQPEEVPILRQHVQYWQKLFDQGVCSVAGHTLNMDENAFALVIVRADSESAAREIIERAPLVRVGIARVTVFPFEGLMGKNAQPSVSEASYVPARENVTPESKAPASTDLKGLTLAYLEAVGQKQFDRLSALLASNMEFTVPGGNTIHGAQDYIAALRRLGPILARNDVKRVFVDGNEVCVIYDFVTDTSVGAVPSVEWLKFEDGRIRSSRLVFHSLPWPKVLEELSRRTSPASSEKK